MYRVTNSCTASSKYSYMVIVIVITTTAKVILPLIQWQLDCTWYSAVICHTMHTGFTSLNGLICLHSVLDKAGSQSVFKRT